MKMNLKNYLFLIVPGTVSHITRFHTTRYFVRTYTWFDDTSQSVLFFNSTDFRF